MRVKAAQFLRNGDSCGICPCWRRPEPRIRCRVGPWSGFRCRAALQQPLLHRRRCIRHGLVRCIHTCKHVTICYRYFSRVTLAYCNYVTLSCLGLFIQSQRYTLLSLTWTCCFRLKPVACTFLFYAGLLKMFPLSFRFALTERDKFTQSLTSVKGALIMLLLEIHYSVILHCKFSF